VDGAGKPKPARVVGARTIPRIVAVDIALTLNNLFGNYN
jgi:hypothetical protein